MPTLVDFCMVVLATGAIIQAWHQGSLFADKRARLQAEQDVIEPESWRGLWIELLMCPFCKSYHVPFWLLVALLISSLFGDTALTVTRLVIYALAATRASNLIDAALPARMRYEPPIHGD